MLTFIPLYGVTNLIPAKHITQIAASDLLGLALRFDACEERLQPREVSSRC